MPEGYHLRPGDLLTVSVWKETELQSEVLIRPDGGMSFALAGDVQAAGHTVKELADILQTKVREYIPAAVVTVSVKSILGNQVFVIGKVNKPGLCALTGPMDVMQALKSCGWHDSLRFTQWHQGITPLGRSPQFHTVSLP